MLGQDPSQIDGSYSVSTDAITIDAFGEELEFTKKQCGKATVLFMGQNGQTRVLG